jgi:hypothetical protein
MIEAEEENDFMENALLMWWPASSTEDYHSQVNLENYEKWLQKKLIPNSPLNSVIIINTMPYHNVLLEHTPSSNRRKVDIINRISSHGILYSDDMFKLQLYTLIQINISHS